MWPQLMVAILDKWKVYVKFYWYIYFIQRTTRKNVWDLDGAPSISGRLVWNAKNVKSVKVLYFITRNRTF